MLSPTLMHMVPLSLRISIVYPIHLALLPVAHEPCINKPTTGTVSTENKGELLESQMGKNGGTCIRKCLKIFLQVHDGNKALAILGKKDWIFSHL